MWHLASLDAPTVAVVWAWAFGRALHVPLPTWALGLLALIVWAIYVGDRLLDALSGLRDPKWHPLQERHYFHWRNRRVLAPLAAVAAIAAAWIVHRRLPGLAIRQDSVVAVAAVAYFSGVHTRSSLPGWIKQTAARLFSREFAVGAIFSAGCSLPVLSALRTHGHTASWPRLLVLALFFALLAWLNVRAISDWEDTPFPAPTKRVGRLAGAIGAMGLSAAVLLAASGSEGMAAVLAAGSLSAGWLALLNRLRPRLTSLTLRIGADFVLLTPLLLATWRPTGQ